MLSRTIVKEYGAVIAVEDKTPSVIIHGTVDEIMKVIDSIENERCGVSFVNAKEVLKVAKRFEGRLTQLYTEAGVVNIEVFFKTRENFENFIRNI